MVDVEKLNIGDRVKLNSQGHSCDGEIFLFISYVWDTTAGVTDVGLLLERDRKTVVHAKPSQLEHPNAINTVDTVSDIHQMRNAGPPQPDCCTCDIVSLMNVGCRCGWLARERVWKENL